MKKIIDKKQAVLEPTDLEQVLKSKGKDVNYTFDRAKTGSLVNFAQDNGLSTYAVLKKHGRVFSPELN